MCCSWSVMFLTRYCCGTHDTRCQPSLRPALAAMPLMRMGDPSNLTQARWVPVLLFRISFRHQADGLTGALEAIPTLRGRTRS